MHISKESQFDTKGAPVANLLTLALDRCDELNLAMVACYVQMALDTLRDHTSEAIIIDSTEEIVRFIDNLPHES